MDAIERGQFPSDLMQGRSRFQAWRGQRKLGDRIPPRSRRSPSGWRSCTGSAVPQRSFASTITACNGESEQPPPKLNRAILRLSNCRHRFRSAKNVVSNSTTEPEPPCTCSWSATMRPTSSDRVKALPRGLFRRRATSSKMWLAVRLTSVTIFDMLNGFCNVIP